MKPRQAGLHALVEELANPLDGILVAFGFDPRNGQRVIILAQPTRLAVLQRDRASQRNPVDVLEPAGLLVRKIDHPAVAESHFIQLPGNSGGEQRARNRGGGDLHGVDGMVEWRRSERAP